MTKRVSNSEAFIESLRNTFELPYYKKYGVSFESNLREDLINIPKAVELGWKVCIDERDSNRLPHAKTGEVALECVHIPNHPVSFELDISASVVLHLWECGTSYPTARLWWRCVEHAKGDDGIWRAGDLRRDYETLEEALEKESNYTKSF